MDGVIRRLAGLGKVDRQSHPEHRHTVHHHPGILVVGGGVAGLSAALAASDQGKSVVLAEEHGFGEKLPPGPLRDRVRALASQLSSRKNVTVLERSAAIGVYEG